MKNKIKAFFIFLIILFFNQKIHAQPGTLDYTFGDSGLVIYDISTTGDGSIIQPDGKILELSEGYGNTVISRFNPDGTFDSTFGQDGRAYFSYDYRTQYGAYDIAMQEDGKIVITCNYFPNGEPLDLYYIGIIRCNVDGSPDSSFGINGLDTMKFDKLNKADGLVIQPDGKILVSGDSKSASSAKPKSFIFRLMPNGGLDSSFGENGSVIKHYDEYSNTVGLLLRPNGKLIKGLTFNIYSPHPVYQLESYNPDGSADEGFGINGLARFVFGEGQGGQWNSIMRDLALQEDGKIVCTGISGSSEITIALCRINEDGSVDQGFGDAGGFIVPNADPQGMYASSISFQNDGKIVVCGDGGAWPLPIVLARFTQDGQLDPEFGENGITLTTADPYASGGGTVHALTDGKILITGAASYEGYILLARYNGDNVLASHFKEVKAIQENDNITITWQTLNESNTKSYTVERSNNAKDYAGINTIPAKHAATNSYSHTDKNPLYGDNYYRIKENAANGTFTYSQTLKVVFENGSKISLYPNPAKNTVTIKGLDKNATAVIKITDMNGREISKFNFSNTSIATISIRALAQGSYFILVEQNGKVTKLRLVKQ